MIGPSVSKTSTTVKVILAIQSILILGLCAGFGTLVYKTGGFNLDTVDDKIDARLEGVTSNPVSNTNVGIIEFGDSSAKLHKLHRPSFALNDTVNDTVSTTLVTTIVNAQNETIVFTQTNPDGTFWDIRNFTSDMQWQSTEGNNVSICAWDAALYYYAAVPADYNISVWTPPTRTTISVQLPPPYTVQEGMVPSSAVQNSKLVEVYTGPSRIETSGRTLATNYEDRDGVPSLLVNAYYVSPLHSNLTGHAVQIVLKSPLRNVPSV